MTVPPVEPAPRGSAVDWVLVVWITLLAGWAGVLALAFLPQYVGACRSRSAPCSAVAAMIVAPRLCYRLTGSMAAALLPVLLWFGLTVWVVLSRNGIMPTRPLTVSAGQWRVMVLLGLGSLSAAASIGLLWGDRLRDQADGATRGRVSSSRTPAPGDTCLCLMAANRRPEPSVENRRDVCDRRTVC